MGRVADVAADLFAIRPGRQQQLAVGYHPHGDDRRGEPVRQPPADAQHAAAAGRDGGVTARRDGDEPTVLRLCEPAAEPDLAQRGEHLRPGPHRPGRHAVQTDQDARVRVAGRPANVLAGADHRVHHGCSSPRHHDGRTCPNQRQIDTPRWIAPGRTLAARGPDGRCEAHQAKVEVATDERRGVQPGARRGGSSSSPATVDRLRGTGRFRAVDTGNLRKQQHSMRRVGRRLCRWIRWRLAALGVRVDARVAARIFASFAARILAGHGPDPGTGRHWCGSPRYGPPSRTLSAAVPGGVACGCRAAVARACRCGRCPPPVPGLLTAAGWGCS